MKVEATRAPAKVEYLRRPRHHLPRWPWVGGEVADRLGLTEALSAAIARPASVAPDTIRGVPFEDGQARLSQHAGNILDAESVAGGRRHLPRADARPWHGPVPDE